VRPLHISRTVFSLTPYSRPTAAAEARGTVLNWKESDPPDGRDLRKMATTVLLDNIARGLAAVADLNSTLLDWLPSKQKSEDKSSPGVSGGWFSGLRIADTPRQSFSDVTRKIPQQGASFRKGAKWHPGPSKVQRDRPRLVHNPKISPDPRSDLKSSPHTCTAKPGRAPRSRPSLGLQL
jgi:hypothetical protein